MKRVEWPNKAWVGEVLVEEQGVLRQPKSTNGNTSIQLLVFSARIRIDVLRVRWKRSIAPLAWGWYAEVWI